MASAEELKYVSAVKAEVAREFSTPSPELVKLLARRVYEGSMTAKVLTVFEGITIKALRQYVTDQVNARLKTALDGAAVSGAGEVEVEGVVAVDPGAVQTTQDEAEAFLIVRAILASEVPVERVTARDRQSYFGVLLDDNNRKPICRFHFNGQSVKYIGLFDANKVETRHQVFALNDIYQHADALRATVRNYS